jgi:glycerol uptake facilitator-like aquaporin
LRPVPVVSLYVTPPVNGQQPFIDFSVIGLVHVFVLFMLVQTPAVVSGAHFNPAVTAGMLVIRQIKPVDAVIYWLCQLAGGVAAALVTKALVEDEGRGVKYGATIVSSHLNTFGGICAEAIGAFFLMWAIFGVAVNPTAFKGWAGLVIGVGELPLHVHPAREEGRRRNAAGGSATPRGPSSRAGRPHDGA